ncbi:unnamed protein product [Hermetia illucens]|uniref:BTB domain-containing protein n=2 Tax=Hermetia illucens TaxID=343691 RepID=A0A7R8Z1J5_HERIL|nr:unnamed protein product [Hermetia illucens]
MGTGFRSGLESFDLTLRVRDKEIPVHKLILVRASQYFKVLFSGCFADSGKKVLEMNQFEPEIVEMIVEFLYSRTLNLSTDTVMDVYEVADFLQVTKVLLFCIQFMIESVDAINCISFWKFADFHSLPPLRAHLQTYICTSLEDVMKTTEFLELEFEDLKSLMTDVELSRLEWLQSYRSTFSALMGWMNHNASRNVHLESLVNLARDQEKLSRPKPDEENVRNAMGRLQCSR